MYLNNVCAVCTVCVHVCMYVCIMHVFMYVLHVPTVFLFVSLVDVHVHVVGWAYHEYFGIGASANHFENVEVIQ